MLFDTGPDYNFMLILVPSWPGITMPATVDNLLTSRWAHLSLYYEYWENLGKYKRRLAVGSVQGICFYLVHFSDQEGSFPGNYGISAMVGHCYNCWKGAILLIRMRANGRLVS